MPALLNNFIGQKPLLTGSSLAVKEYLKHTDERMPGDRNRSKSSPAWLWGVVVVVATGVVMIAFVVILVSIRRRQGRKSEGKVSAAKLIQKIASTLTRKKELHELSHCRSQ